MSETATKALLRLSALGLVMLGCAGPAASADLGGMQRPVVEEPIAAGPEWTFKFTSYGWLPWMSGNTVVKGRNLDVQVNPVQILDHLDWSTLPVWMSYMEARHGPVMLFNDIVYTALSGSTGFAKSVGNPVLGATLGANVSVDYVQATVEFGGAYEVWTGRNPVTPGPTAFDLLAGGRYWHQEFNASADLATTVNVGGLTVSGGRVFARSGSVDWVDPFVGGRIRNQVMPGQELVVRGDVGGFGAGSEFSWQVLATYNMQLCTTAGYVIDGYFGYRALSVDYSQGSGNSKYEYNVLQQGPVIGATMRF